MQRIVSDEPYAFVAPRFSRFWHAVARRLLPGLLRRSHGVTAVECVGAEKLRASLEAGHGVLIVANHCRPCDPMVMDWLARAVARPFSVIASWNVFFANRVQGFLLPRVGAFSVYREGMDRESLKCAVDLVAEGRFPLVIFPEGFVTRSNDRLATFMEGSSFMARAAAKQRKEGQVVVHPVFIRYFFEGDLERAVLPVLEDVEKRLSWQPQSHLPLKDRVRKVGDALLAVKELEYGVDPRHGTFPERLERLRAHLLEPLEERWTSGRHDGDTMARVKRLRAAILPDMVAKKVSDEERAARWRQLADLYFVQQLHCCTGDYLDGEPSPERLLETVDRYEEDLTDEARPHPPLRAVLTVDDAIPVSAARDRSAEVDPVTAEIRARMERLLESSKNSRNPVAPA